MIDLVVWIMGVNPEVAVVRDGAQTFPYAMASVAIFSTVFGVINTLILFPVVPLLVRLVTAMAPDTPADEAIGTAQYIFADAAREPDTALDLVEREQRRFVRQFPKYLDEARGQGASSASYPQLHASLTALGKEGRPAGTRRGCSPPTLMNPRR